MICCSFSYKPTNTSTDIYTDRSTSTSTDTSTDIYTDTATATDTSKDTYTVTDRSTKTLDIYIKITIAGQTKVQMSTWHSS